MKKTYVKPSIQVIELGIEAAMMVGLSAGQQTQGWGTNGSTTKSENSNNPWDASSWSMAPNSSASSSNSDEE